MTEEEDKQEEKFDFTSEGEALGYISLEQARLLAMQTARTTQATTVHGSPMFQWSSIWLSKRMEKIITRLLYPYGRKGISQE